MSTTTPPPAPYTDASSSGPDVASPKKPTKAQAPFLVHQRHKARGSPAPPHPFLRAAILYSLVAFISSALLSRSVTESWFWGKDLKVQRAFEVSSRLIVITAKLFERETNGSCDSQSSKGYRDMALTRILGQSYDPASKVFSVAELKKYDGTNPDLPIYLAIDGKVYDVSPGRATYGPGGSYSFFAGVDASRAYVTGCFADHITHDLRGLTEKQLDGLRHWKDFFAKSQKYKYVGRVANRIIDPASPIPEQC